MTWHWILLIIILVFGNFLMLGSMLIGFAQTPAVLISGGDIKYRNPPRYIVGVILAFILQSIAAVTLSALIISYVYFIAQGKGNILMWIIGSIGAVYPIWQAVRLSGYEEVHEPKAFQAKEAVHRLIVLSLITTVIFTLLFVFIPSFLNAVFYWLVGLAAIVAVCAVISIIIMARKFKAENEDGE